MRQRRKKTQIQIELFYEPQWTSSPIMPLEMPPDRRVDLEKLIAQLLLEVLLDGVPKGGEHDA
jgi:hypothetical protein